MVLYSVGQTTCLEKKIKVSTWHRLEHSIRKSYWQTSISHHNFTIILLILARWQEEEAFLWLTGWVLHTTTAVSCSRAAVFQLTFPSLFLFTVQIGFPSHLFLVINSVELWSPDLAWMFLAQHEDAYPGTTPGPPEGNTPCKTVFDSYTQCLQIPAERPPRANRTMQLQL